MDIAAVVSPVQGSHSTLVFPKDEPNPLCAPLFPSRAHIPIPPITKSVCEGKIHKNTPKLSLILRDLSQVVLGWDQGANWSSSRLGQVFFPAHIPEKPIFSCCGQRKLRRKPSKSYGIQGKREKFNPKLSLEGGGQGQTSPGLKLSFPAPFPGAGSHPWTASTHPARKVAWMCFSRDGATGIKEAFPDPALPPGVSAPGRQPGGTFPRECGVPAPHPAWGFHMEQRPLLTQNL